MKNDIAPAVIVVEHGSFLLIRAGACFSVVERRAGRIYPMLAGERKGEPMTPEGLAAVMAEEGSVPEGDARRLFDELCERGDRLAQRIC
jgi:hypothetical protein